MTLTCTGDLLTTAAFFFFFFSWKQTDYTRSGQVNKEYFIRLVNNVDKPQSMRGGDSNRIFVGEAEGKKF